MSKRVYLAGPITGLRYAEGQSWRDHAQNELGRVGIEAFSPLRSKAYLNTVDGPLTASCDGYDVLGVLSSKRGIMTRDRWDATRCDVILVNLLGAKSVSIGTVMEIAWADAVRTPIVCAIEPEGNVHEHAMIQEALGFRVPTLDEAIQVTRAILEP